MLYFHFREKRKMKMIRNWHRFSHDVGAYLKNEIY